MTFKPFSFTYTPPKTVSTPVDNTIINSAIPSINTSSSKNTSSAQKLIDKANLLLETNLYLQQIILEKSQGLGITLDSSINVEVGQSFSALYPSLPIPSIITINMYNRILDAEMGIMQINSGLGINNSLEVSGIESGAVSQINNFIENSLCNSGEFSSSLPLLLGNLKGDAVILNNLTASISTYPVVNVPLSNTLNPVDSNLIQMSGQDVSPDLANSIDESLSSIQSSYSSVYQLTAGTGVVDQNINTVINSCVNEPTPNLIRMVGALTNLLGSNHTPSLSKLTGDLTSLVFVQLISEATGFQTLSDRFIQSAISPLKGITSGIGKVMSSLNSLEQASVKTSGIQGTFSQTSGSLQGMSLAYNNGLPTSSKTTALPTSVGNINPGLLSIASHINLSITSSNRNNSTLTISFKKLLNRKTSIMNDMIGVLASLKDVNSTINVAKSVISYKQSGSSNSTGTNNIINPVQAVGQLLTSSKSSSGANYIISNGAIQAIPTNIQTPSSSVKSSLISAGTNIIVPSQLSNT